MEVETTQRSLLLPEEVINEEILPKLAVKSLLRFRCVSKSWHSLIDSKRFVKTQLQSSTKNTSLAHQRVVMFDFPCAAIWQCSFLSLLDKQPELHPLKFNWPTDIPIDSVYSVSPMGCCDGLVFVCVALKEQHPGRSVELILWNPSTRISKKLPHNTKMARYSSYMHYGFGWDESSGDYKVVTFAIDHEGQSTCQIYSLESDVWKEVDVPYSPHGYCKQGVLLGKGKLHWMSYDYDGGNLEQIDCFDLEREVFETVEPPPFSDQSSWSRWLLGKIQEYLVVYHSHDNHANDSTVGDFWVKKESWEKLMVVDNTPRPIWTSPSIDSFCIGGEEGISLILMDSGKLIAYNVKFHRWIVHYDEYVVCVESLVSPLG